MFYECRRCHREEFRGVLPGVTCGLLLALYSGLGGAILLLVVEALAFPDGFGWWIVLLLPACLAGGMVLAIPIAFVLELAEWLFVSLRSCRHCGSHRMSHGRTRGFGL